MKKILLVSPHPQLESVVSNALSGQVFGDVIYCPDLKEAEPFLRERIAETCIVEAEPADIQGIWQLEKILRLNPACRVIVYAENSDRDWEEQAYLKGARHVLHKPVRRQELLKLIAEPKQPATSHPLASVQPQRSARQEEHHCIEGNGNGWALLKYSLDDRALCGKAIEVIRTEMGINRSLILVQDAQGIFETMAAGGLPGAIIRDVRFSTDSGIGQALVQRSRVMKATAEDLDDTGRAELALVGAEIAIPIQNEIGMVGMLLIDRRVTGEVLSEREILGLFEISECLGNALQNTQTYQKLVRTQQTLDALLKEIEAVSVAIDKTLEVVFANRSARRVFGGKSNAELSFSDIPQEIGAKMYQVLRTGTGLTPLEFRDGKKPETSFRVNVVPVYREKEKSPDGAMLIASVSKEAPIGDGGARPVHNGEPQPRRNGEEQSYAI